MDIGLKIVKEGQDVRTARDPDLVFSTKLSAMPIALQGIVEQTSSSNFDFTIKHGLGFVPFFLTFYKTSEFPTYWQWSPSFVQFLGDSASVFAHRVNTENLVVRVNIFSGSTTVTVKYIIFNFPIALSI